MVPEKKLSFGLTWKKIIINKNLTIFYVNCDSLQLHFLKKIWIVFCLKFCNLSVFIFLINSFSIALICLSPFLSWKVSLMFIKLACKVSGWQVALSQIRQPRTVLSTFYGQVSTKCSPWCLTPSKLFY